MMPPGGAGVSQPGGMPAAPEPHVDLEGVVADLRHQLRRLEAAIGAEMPPAECSVRAFAGEERWPVTLAIAAAIALQASLSRELELGPSGLLVGLESALGVALLVANPRRIDRRSRVLRAMSITLIALTSMANAWASYSLIRDIVVGHRPTLGAVSLLASGGAVYLTNIVVFGLWYWEWESGGPVARARSGRPRPDLAFPQDLSNSVAAPGWAPTFADYLYVSYTNATAFSPTDTMPLSRWAKLLMMLQSAVALVTVGLVVARAVNILP